MAYLQLVRRRVLAQLAQTRGWQRGHSSVGSSRNIGECLGCGEGSSSSNSNVGRRAGFATHAVPSPETATEPVQVPSHARVVIVGGGVIGSSTAYHLSKLGWKDIVLLEQNSLTSGTTWHAAGLIGTSRATDTETRLSVEGSRLYGLLEEETGQDPGYKLCGSLTVARTPDRMTALARTLARSQAFGIEGELLTPEDCRRVWSHDGVDLLRTDDIEGDGTGSPTDLTMALIKGARSRGVQVREGVRVTEFDVARSGGRRQVCGVQTTSGPIQADIVVLCAGQWSRQLGKAAGVRVPLHSAEHFYVITDPIPGVHGDLPIMRDTDAYLYFREWGGGLCVGGFEPNAKPIFSKEVPTDFAFSLLPDDWEHFEFLLNHAFERVPALQDAGIVSMVNGPESFTSDSRYILGESPEIANFFVVAGMNSSGVASAGGAGLAIAQWIDQGQEPMDLWATDVRRFGDFHTNPAYLSARVSETLGLHYAMPWPNREHVSGRGLRRSALYAQLKETAGAVFGEKFGWERPLYFQPADADGNREELNTGTFGKPDFLSAVKAEANATRSAVGIFDQSSFAKFSVAGPGACALLQWLCGNNVDVDIGRVVYTGMFNARGGFETDVTVTRLADDCFQVGTRDYSWLSRHAAELAAQGGPVATVTDVTSGYATLGVMGPQSRELLESVSTCDMSQTAFPFGTAQSIDVGYAMASARRVTYVGELGWELYVPVESAYVAYEALKGNPAGITVTDAGYAAIDSLRVEKFYRAWGHELTPERTPFETGLSFAVDFDTPNKDFIGREALLKARDTPLSSRVICVVLDEEVVGEPWAMLWGGEAIVLDDAVVGYITSGTYGHTIGSAIGLGFVRHEAIGQRGFVGGANWEVVIGDRRVKAKGRLTAAVDPKGRRVQGMYT